MLFLTPEHLSDLLHPRLIDIISDLDGQMGSLFVTSLYRKGDKGVHSTFPVRGIDFRCRDQGIAKSMAKYLNSRWQYDPMRPGMRVAIAHNAGSGMHLHVQSHPSTKSIA